MASWVPSMLICRHVVDIVKGIDRNRAGPFLLYSAKGSPKRLPRFGSACCTTLASSSPQADTLAFAARCINAFSSMPLQTQGKRRSAAQDAPVKRFRVSQACDQCRTERSKCDGNQPQCAPCFEGMWTCIQPSVPRSSISRPPKLRV